MFRIILSIFLTATIGCGGGSSSGDDDTTPKTILFFGDSITDGYTLGKSASYPANVQTRIADLGLPHTVINAGVSGDTSADGLKRLDLSLTQTIDIFVLALGTNDSLRDIPAATTESNLRKILIRVKEAYPQVRLVIAGTEIFRDEAEPSYRAAFAQLFKNLSEEFGAQLIPNILQGVHGTPKLNLRDGLHPNAAGHKVIAENIWQTLEPML